MNTIIGNFLFNQRVGRVLSGLAIVLGLIVIFTGQHRFIVWDQIRYYHQLSERQYEGNEVELREVEDEFNIPMNYDISNLSHIPRIYLTYPVLILSRLFGVNSDTVFSLWVLINFLLCAYLLSKTIVGKNEYTFHLFLGAFFFVSLFMNGRLSFAFLGISTLVYLFDGVAVRSTWRRTLLLCMALWFASVSSGALAVCYALVFFMGIRNFVLKSRVNREHVSQLISCGLSLIIWTPWLLAGVMKNLKFYSGSIWKMASHGYGTFLHKIDWRILLILLVGIMAIWFGRNLIRKTLLSKDYFFTKLSIVTSLIGGIYGYSVIAAFFPCYVLLCCLTVLKAFPSKQELLSSDICR